MTRLLDTLKALCGCAAAMVLLVVFVVSDRIAGIQPEGDAWYD